MALAAHFRFLARRKAVAAAAILTMALALGANSAAYSVVRAFLLSGLAVPEPDRVVLIGPERELPGRGSVLFNDAWPNYELIRDTRRSFDAVTALLQGIAGWDDGGTIRPLRTTLATAGFFATMRVQPAMGRAFIETEEGPSPAPVVVLSHSLWRSAFQADPAVIGRAITVNGVPTTVIGVMPPGFGQPAPTDIWQPFDLPAPQRATITGGRILSVFGRIADGTSRETAAAEMETFTRLTKEANDADNRDYRYVMHTLREQLLSGAGDTVLLVQAGAAALLLLAVLNLASVLVAWGFDRRRELAVRLALGAGEGRVTGQLLVQAALIVCAGLAVGLVLAEAALMMIRRLDLGPQLEGFLAGVRLDPGVLAVSAAVAALVALGAGILPAWFGRRTDLADTLRSSSRGATLSAGALRWQQGMVVIQAALSIVVVTAGTLVALSFRHLDRIPDGFAAEHRGVARVTLPSTYGTHAERVAFADALLAALEREPGLRSYGVSSTLPVGDQRSGARFFLPGPDGVTSTDPLLFHFRRVSPGYLQAMAIPLLSGRNFEVHDDSASAPVAIVSAALAASYFPNGDAIGREVRRVVGGTTVAHRIVGIVGNVMDGGYAAGPGEALYVPFGQVSVARLSIVAVSATTPAAGVEAIRRALAAASPIVAANGTTSLEALAWQVNALPRLRTLVLIALSLVAVTLVGLGSYGVMRQLVASREREFALRLVFGARPAHLGATVGAQLARLTVPGVAAGIAGAWVAAGLLSSFVVGVEPRSWLVLGGVGLGVLALAGLAAAPSVLRAMRTDPRRIAEPG